MVMTAKFSKFQSYIFAALVFFILTIAGKCENTPSQDPPPAETNSAPTSIALSTNSISENEPIGSLIGTFSSTDTDSEAFTYSLEEGEGADDNANFIISGDSLKSNLSFNFENQASHSIRVQTNDGNGGTFQMVFNIIISNANEAPTAIALSANNITENEPIGSFIGIFSSTDVDSDNFTYSLESGEDADDNANFIISGDSLKSNLSFNFEAQANHSIRVQTNDGNGGTFQMVFTITIIDSDDPPITTLSNTLVDENLNSGAVVGIFSTRDEDIEVLSDVTYTLVSGSGDTDNDSVSFSGDTLKTAISFDYERKTSYTIRVRSENTSGLSFEESFTITVNNLAEWFLASDNPGWPGRRGHESITFDNKIWITGGYDEIDQFNDVWSSIDGIVWTEVNSSAGWDAGRGHSSVVFDNKIWVIGGRTDGNRDSNDVWSSTDGIVWTEVNSSAGWDARRGHTSVVFDNKIWVMGGRTGGEGSNGANFNDVWSSTDSIWTEVNSSAGWDARRGHTSVVFDNKIWVMGGSITGSDLLNDVWSSTDGIVWTEVNSSAGWGYRRGHSSVVFDNKIWIIGGIDESKLNDVWYSTDGIMWTEGLSGNSNWNESAETVVFDNKIWRLGGCCQGINDIWYYGL